MEACRRWTQNYNWSYVCSTATSTPTTRLRAQSAHFSSLTGFAVGAPEKPSP